MNICPDSIEKLTRVESIEKLKNYNVKVNDISFLSTSLCDFKMVKDITTILYDASEYILAVDSKIPKSFAEFFSTDITHVAYFEIFKCDNILINIVIPLANKKVSNIRHTIKQNILVPILNKHNVFTEINESQGKEYRGIKQFQMILPLNSWKKIAKEFTESLHDYKFKECNNIYFELVMYNIPSYNINVIKAIGTYINLESKTLCNIGIKTNIDLFVEDGVGLFFDLNNMLNIREFSIGNKKNCFVNRFNTSKVGYFRNIRGNNGIYKDLINFESFEIQKNMLPEIGSSNILLGSSFAYVLFRGYNQDKIDNVYEFVELENLQDIFCIKHNDDNKNHKYIQNIVKLAKLLHNQRLEYLCSLRKSCSCRLQLNHSAAATEINTLIEKLFNKNCAFFKEFVKNLIKNDLLVLIENFGLYVQHAERLLKTSKMYLGMNIKQDVECKILSEIWLSELIFEVWRDGNWCEQKTLLEKFKCLEGIWNNSYGEEANIIRNMVLNLWNKGSNVIFPENMSVILKTLFMCAKTYTFHDFKSEYQLKIERLLNKYEKIASNYLNVKCDNLFVKGPQNVEKLVSILVSKESIVNCILHPTTILGFLINCTILSKNDDLKALNYSINLEVKDWRFFPNFLLNKHVPIESIQWCRLIKQDNIYKMFSTELNFNDSKLSPAITSKDQQSLRSTSEISGNSSDIQVITNKKVCSKKPCKQVQSKLSLSANSDDDVISIDIKIPKRSNSFNLSFNETESKKKKFNQTKIGATSSNESSTKKIQLVKSTIKNGFKTYENLNSSQKGVNSSIIKNKIDLSKINKPKEKEELLQADKDKEETKTKIENKDNAFEMSNSDENDSKPILTPEEKKILKEFLMKPENIGLVFLDRPYEDIQFINSSWKKFSIKQLKAEGAKLINEK